MVDECRQLSIHEAAAYLGLKPRAVHDYIGRKCFPGAWKDGRGPRAPWRIPQDSAELFLVEMLPERYRDNRIREAEARLAVFDAAHEPEAAHV